MNLRATPKNPIPIGASTGYIEPRKGLRLRYASWQSALRERRGTVCIFQGRAEFIEKYFEVVGELPDYPVGHARLLVRKTFGSA